MPLQDFITGPANNATHGYFGVDTVTGEGYAFATDAWADAPEEPVGNHCIDSWTLAPVKVPIAGAWGRGRRAGACAVQGRGCWVRISRGGGRQGPCLAALLCDRP